MEHIEPSDDITHIAEAKIHIERLSTFNRTTQYQNIVDLVNQYLQENCKHNEIVEDEIDIDPEKSMRIQYCNHCGLTM